MTTMQELTKGKPAPSGGGRQTMGSLVCLPAQGGFTAAELKAPSRLHTPAPASAVPG